MSQPNFSHNLLAEANLEVKVVCLKDFFPQYESNLFGTEAPILRPAKLNKEDYPEIWNKPNIEIKHYSSDESNLISEVEEENSYSGSCSICFLDLKIKKVVILDCLDFEHIFHATCLKKWNSHENLFSISPHGQTIISRNYLSYL